MSSRICEPSNERVKSNLYIYHSNAERQAATHLSQGRVARAYDVPFFPQKTRLFLKCTVTLQLRENLVTLYNNLFQKTAQFVQLWEHRLIPTAVDGTKVVSEMVSEHLGKPFRSPMTADGCSKRLKGQG